ncbi:hypothetical protein EHQ52_08610 [Leptospira koniambonensis]|uniref:Porin n=1 Tax=Leptospira koniambonensis TaxID=2484950 RepID=A0A4R9J734_9LEPT|nr:hypothetical protein [Leptospira koniambonensis]TGL34553.1 hypothetical protein EHQ52_08610 [Leptospira koniambonensis]
MSSRKPDRYLKVYLGLILFLSSYSIWSFDIITEDKKLSVPSKFTVNGTLWVSYGLNDKKPNGAPDYSGPNSQSTGFRVARALVNIQGDIEEGEYKGYGFRITPDVYSTYSQEANGCTNFDGSQVCQGFNDYAFSLRFAYFNMPLFDRFLTLRVGQQPAAVTISPVFNLTEMMAHRYIDGDPTGRMGASAAFQNFGFSTGVERGLSIFHKDEYYGFHFMLGNESTHRRNNAQDLEILTVTGSSDKLNSLSNGSGDSYGLDFQGILNFLPTGDSKKFLAGLSSPFIFKNITGIDRDEVEYNSANFVCTADCQNHPRVRMFRGEKRAKQDIYFGLQTDLAYNEDSFSFALGGGPYYFLDRRGKSSLINEQILFPEDFFNQGLDTTVASNEFRKLYATNTRDERDSLAKGLYFYTHVRYKKIGAFLMYTTGTGNGMGRAQDPVTGVMSAPSNVPWIDQVVRYDLQTDGVLGNVNIRDIFDLRNHVDHGKARFYKTVASLNYFPMERLKISLAVIQIVSIDQTGKPTRVNSLERIRGDERTTGVESHNVSDQFSEVVLTSLGFPNGVTVNDLIGKPLVETQTLIATEYIF